MKKTLSVVLALCLVLSMAGAALADGLAVGTYDPASAGEVTLNFAWWGNQTRDAVTLDACNYFTENYPNVTINPNAQSWNNYWALMTTNSANNDLPDVMQQDHAYIEQWAEAGDLLELTPYIESGALDVSNIPESILDTGRVNGGLYAVVCAENARAMVYNKTLTDSLGIEVPMNITWDEFVAITKQIVEATGGYRALYGDGNSENPIQYYARSLGHNALFDENGMTLTAEELAGYYQRLLDGVAEGYLFDTDAVAGVDTANINQYPLVYGSSPEVRSWCSLCFSNQLATYVASAEADGIELGITTWPSSDPDASNYLKPGQFFAVTTDTKNPDLAVAFLNYLLNDVQGNILLAGERGVPPVTTVASAIADALAESAPTYPTTVEYLAYVADGHCSAMYPPQPSYVGTAQEIIKEASETMLTKGCTTTALEMAEYVLEEIAEIAEEN